VIFGVEVVFPVVITFGIAGVLAERHTQAAVQEFFPWSSASALMCAGEQCRNVASNSIMEVNLNITAMLLYGRQTCQDQSSTECCVDLNVSCLSVINLKCFLALVMFKGLWY